MICLTLILINMKKLFYFLSLFFTLAFVSCQSEETFENKTPNTSGLDNDIAIIKQLGFDVSTLVDKGDYYLVEGDIGLVKKNLKQHLEEFKGYAKTDSKLKQGYLSGRLVSLDNVKNMTIRIDASVPTSGTGSDWRTAALTAIDAWNNITGSCVKFIYTTSTTADITVKRAYSSQGEYAKVSDFPLNQKPSKEIIVNSMFDNNFSYKANTIIHEMGHAVGLLHTHYTPAEQGGVLIPGTPTIDDTSIMSYNRNRALLPGFNSNDLIAIRYLYPAPVGKVYFKDINITNSGTTTTVQAVLYTSVATEVTMQVGLHISSNENAEATFYSEGTSIVVNKNNISNPDNATKIFYYQAGSHNVSFTLTGKNMNTQAAASIIGAKASGGTISIEYPSSLEIGLL